MGIVVQKFGGTSVESKDKLQSVIEKIEMAKKEGKKVAVIVSAQGRTTDILINKANEYCEKTYSKEMDLLLSTGEIQTVALLTMMLKNKGYDAIGMTGGQAGVITDSNFSNARIKMVMSENIMKHLESGKIVIIAGFQGIDKFGNITTLGRGGSDLSAVAIASSLKAEKCEIYTDVDGVFSADPNVIHNAKLIEEISYDEMLVAATAGAKVLHNRAVGMSKKYNLKLEVRNTRSVALGTKVLNIKNNVNEEYTPKILAMEKGLAKLTIVGQNLIPKCIIKIYSLAASNNIPIYMVSLNDVEISIAIKQKDADEFSRLLHDSIMETKKANE